VQGKEKNTKFNHQTNIHPNWHTKARGKNSKSKSTKRENSHDSNKETNSYNLNEVNNQVLQIKTTAKLTMKSMKMQNHQNIFPLNIDPFSFNICFGHCQHIFPVNMTMKIFVIGINEVRKLSTQMALQQKEQKKKGLSKFF
jgi:hypothetical protein